MNGGELVEGSYGYSGSLNKLKNKKNGSRYLAAVVDPSSALGTPFGQNPECLGVPESRRHAARNRDALTQWTRCNVHSTAPVNPMG